MKNLKTIICVGLPASGKSTWSIEYIRKNPDCVRVNRDDVRAMLRNQPMCEPKVEHMITEVMESLIVSSLKRKLDVIVDNTNLKKEYITRIVDLVKYTSDVEFMVFDVPAKVCIERDSKREKKVGEGVIKNMEKDWKKIIDSYPFQNVKKLPDWMRPTISYVRKPELPQAVVFDIDGTLAVMKNRGPYDWDKVDRDDVNEIVAEHTHIHKTKGRKVILVSGRDEECREMTENWLKFYNVNYDELHMRPNGDGRKDSIVKREIYETNLQDRYDVMCVYDDRLQVLSMWNKMGIFTFNVNNGNHEF